MLFLIDLIYIATVLHKGGQRFDLILWFDLLLVLVVVFDADLEYGDQAPSEADKPDDQKYDNESYGGVASAEVATGVCSAPGGVHDDEDEF